MFNPNNVVYIGAPITDYAPTAADDDDPYTSKIGGQPAWLRPVSAIPDESLPKNQQLNRCARCPKCRSAANLKLLSQIHAPLSVYDRVLYLFMCVACGTPQDSVVFVFRSQLYNPSYDEKAHVSIASIPFASKEALFAVDEDDGWGDEEGTTALMPTPAPLQTDAKIVTAPPPQVYPSATATDNTVYRSALSRPPLPLLIVDSFPEPDGEKETINKKSIAEQLAEVEALHPGITEVSAEEVEASSLGGARGNTVVISEEDDGPIETPDEVASAAYFSRLERCPTQCIRWSPSGQPLLSSASHRPPAVPKCPTCGAARVFEFQLMAPALYFFEKFAKKPTQRKKVPEAGSKAFKQQTIAAVEGSAEDPHFSTITVFTCSSHCYDADHTVTLEYAHVEPEL